METSSDIIKKCALMNDEYQITELLNEGLDPNFEGGWPLRLAARHGSFAVVKALIMYGANPHLLGETGDYFFNSVCINIGLKLKI